MLFRSLLKKTECNKNDLLSTLIQLNQDMDNKNSNEQSSKVRERLKELLKLEDVEFIDMIYTTMIAETKAAADKKQKIEEEKKKEKQKENLIKIKETAKSIPYKPRRRPIILKDNKIPYKKNIYENSHLK